MRSHALAFGAILDSQNESPHSGLTWKKQPSVSLTPDRTRKELLADSWGISSRDDLMEILDQLQSGQASHRHDFWKMRQALLEAKFDNYARVISAQSSAEEQIKAFIVATHLAPIHGKTLPIMAWDFARYINLCRWGYECGYLSEQEAWDRILPAARLLQASYSSWEGFAADYLLGRNFWNPGLSGDNNRIRYTITLLNHPPAGLWSTIDWNASLGKGTTLHDSLADGLLDHYQDPDQFSVPFNWEPDLSPLLILHDTSAVQK